MTPPPNSGRPPRARRRLAGTAVALTVLLAGAVPCAAAPPMRPANPPLNQPVPVTTSAEPVRGAAVSHDGRWLAYGSGRGRFGDLWLRSADPNVVVLPRQLTFDPGDEHSPAFSPDGRWLAYVATGHDAKGDIYLLDLETRGVPVRLTGREATDGGPCFSADGRSVLYHRATPGGEPRLAELPLGLGGVATGPVRELETGGPAQDAAPSPDGRWIVFVSRREDPGGDLFLLDRRAGSATALTDGPAVDTDPTWTVDGQSVLFARREVDTDRDGALTERDRAAVYRLDPARPETGAHPLTSATSRSEQPLATASGGGATFCFLSDRGGVPNLWRLPAEGEIPDRPSAEEQLALARHLAGQVPADPLRTALAFARVRERFAAEPEAAARASSAMADTYRLAGYPAAAARQYRATLEASAGAPAAVLPEEALARIFLARLDGEARWRRAATQAERDGELTRTLEALQAAARGYPQWERVQARSQMEQARWLLERGDGVAALLETTRRLEQTISEYAHLPDLAAEALLLRADALARAGDAAAVVPAYRRVLETYPDEEAAADPATGKLLGLALEAARGTEEQVRFLRQLAEDNRRVLPRLAAGALNRTGDLLYNAEEWARAKGAYRQVLAEFPGQTSQRAAAHLALAEILYREERFRQALDLYESELAGRTGEDRIYRLARAGYIRRSVAAAEFLFTTGEVLSAQALFRDLARYDDGVVEAHRGIIKCAAALGEDDVALTEYQRRLTRAPGAPLNQYAVGLALTYRDDRASLEEARTWLQRAIAGRGQVEYFHQTLGYVQEVLETVHGEKGMLEQAAESYQRAQFLNDPAVNPENAAHLLLNLGNTAFLLQQPTLAFRYYRQRLESGVAFANPETEILFYRRLGAAAFQVYEPEHTVAAFEKALAVLRAQADPKRASRLYDALVQQVQEQYLAPPAEEAPPDPGQAVLAARQSALRAELFALSAVEPRQVPSPLWEGYRAGIRQLLSRQEGLHQQLLDHGKARGLPPGELERARQGLALHLARIRQALDAPLRFAELEAELLDRLGLAYQEAERWGDAAETFDRVFLQNQRLGNHGNLAQNRRSAAYSRYRGAAAVTGAERTHRLGQAAAGFREVIELVAAHGVSTDEEAPDTGALIGIAVQVPLAAGDATQAAFGFSAAQERRLAEGFLARIAVERGELAEAQATLRSQLRLYPDGAAIPEGDQYGVSLLHHRAGLLAFARGETGDAFDRFGASARLSAALGNAASTALNVADMASALAGGAAAGEVPTPARVAALERADRTASALLRADPSLARQQVAVFFHSALGVHWLALADRPAPGVEAAVLRMRALQRSVGHFTAGLEGLPTPPTSRVEWAQATRLHLGAARAAGELGDSPERVAEHLDEALRLSRLGWLPDLEWRALAGQGRLEEALAALRGTPLLRAHAPPGEILRVFGPLVERHLEADAVEEALGLMEELAEVERVHRLAPLLLGSLTAADQRLIQGILPRLLRLRSLDEQARSGNGETLTRLGEERQRERSLLAETLGAERQRVPELLRQVRSAKEQDTLLLLLGLAFRAEELADTGATATDPARRAALAEEVRGLGEQFATVRDQALAALGPGSPQGLLGALAARPAAAMDLVEALPDGEVLARAWRRQSTPGQAPWLALLLTADAFEVVTAATAEDLLQQASLWAAEQGGSRLTLAHDDPSRFLQAPPGTTLALSGTHWLRTFQARQPFRSSLLILPGPAGEHPERPSLTEGYRLLEPDESDAAADRPAAALRSLPLAHTVAVAGPVILGGGVPTRAGESGSPSLVATLEDGVFLPLASLLGGLPRTSLAAFPRLQPRLWFEAGHLLALAGVPTLAVPHPAADADLSGLLERYRTHSANASAAAGGWLLLGYGGMTPDQAAAYAGEQFAAYAQAAEAAFGAGRYPEAAATLEDALLVAEETPSLRRHLPELHRFAREANFAAGDLGRAAHHASALVAHWQESRPDSEEHADALLRLGLVLARQERFGQALPALEEAAEMLANLELTEEAASALASMGVVLENATEYDRALQSFGTAAELGAELQRDDLVAAQQVNLGRLYDLRLSRWARAKQNYLAALELYDASGDLPGVIQALLDTGRCERLLGNFPAAAERYQLALELLDEEPDPVLGAKVVMEQANNAWFQGRYQEAFELQQRVLATAREEGWSLGQVLARNTAGLTWWTLGDNERALRELQRALELAGDLQGRADEVATTLNNIGLVQREQGLFDEALETLNRALEIDRHLKSRWAIAYDLRNIGLTLLRRGEAKTALVPLREAAAEAEAIGDRVNEAKARLALAEAHWTLGENEAAAAFYGQALALSRAMVLRETEWRALHGLARIRLGAGDADGARELLFETVAVVENLRAAIQLEQLRDGFLTDKLDAYRLLVKVLVDQGETERAFTVAERSRSRNFIDLLGNQRLTLRGAVEQELYERQQALKALREEHEALLAQAENDAERAAYRQALASLADQQADLLLNIQVANPELASLVSVQPVDSRQVQKLLDPGVAVLAYYLLEDELLCWVVRADRLALVRTPLSREALEEDIFAYRRLIQNLEPVAAASSDLHARLLEPLLPELEGTRTLGIIPHGPLHYLSFATLGDADRFLVERFPLFYLPSASVLGYTLARRQDEPNRKVLAIGNPDLGTVSLELPFAEQEVGTIRWNFPEVTVLTGEKATEAWVVRNLGGFGIIHLASHGEFDPVNPLFSALKLAQGEENDGNLMAAEVFGLEINADLVVLSACQTGVGKVTGGDDVIGLNRAFFYAGTHAIVSSLWRVSDVSTAVLMKRFYREIGSARSKAASLRAAMLHVKARYPHPGYWGAFTLSGDHQ